MTNREYVDFYLNKIMDEIQSLRNCSCSCSDGIIDDIEDILYKYKEEIENKEKEIDNLYRI